METKIITQDVWIAVDVKEHLPEKGQSVPVLLNFKNRQFDVLHRMKHTGEWFDYPKNITHWLEKKSDMVVLTKSEFEKIISLIKDAHDHGYEIAGSPLMWDMEKCWSEFKKQNNLKLS